MEPIRPAGSSPLEPTAEIPASPTKAPSHPPRSLGAPSGTSVEVYADNEFSFHHSPGHVEAQGSVPAQLWSGTVFAQQSAMAAVHLASGGRFPMREDVQATLGSLSLQGVDPGAPITTADYESHVKGVPPEALFGAFVKDPGRFFQAAGLVARPGVEGLRHGTRFFLEDKGPPPVWAPVEVSLDAEARRVRLSCLEGHPLRGHNEFHFQPDGQGGTRIVQHSAFQGGFLPVTALGAHVLGMEARQKEIWREVHGELSRVRP